MNERSSRSIRIILSFTGLAMLLIYFATGLLMIFSKIFADKFTITTRIGIGAVLMAYAAFRGFRTWQSFRERNNINLILLFIVLSQFFSCDKLNRDPYANTPTTGRIKIAVDETYRPIAEAELDMFLGFYHYADIKPLYVPEKMAFELLLNDSVQFLLASRELYEQEILFFNSKKIIPRHNLIAYDAIAFIIHPQNKDSLITTSQIKDIITGKITDWHQINPATKLNGITVVFDNQYSSTVRYIRDSVCSGAALSNSLTAVSRNAEVINYVSGNNEALGIIGVNWISDQDDSLHLSFMNKIRVVALSRETKATWENSYHPYQAYISSGQYPFTRKIYAINTEPRNGLSTGFAAFLAGENGQRIILKSGILPANAPTRIIEVNSEDVLGQ